MSRTKGAKDLSKIDKAQIIAQKNASICPKEKIAENFGVSVSTVTHLSLANVPDDVAELAEAFETALIQYAKANALKAAKRTFDTIHELPADKAAMVQEKNYNMVRLHYNQPTEIVQMNQQITDAAQKLLITLNALEIVHNEAKVRAAIELTAQMRKLPVDVLEREVKGFLSEAGISI